MTKGQHEERLEKVNNIVYWFFIYRWFIAICAIVFFNFMSFKSTQKNLAINEGQDRIEREYKEYLEALREEPREIYFTYNATTSRKLLYNYWEPITMYSDREILKNHIPIKWKDTLFCDIFDWSLFWLISSKTRDNPQPNIVNWLWPRLYEWTLPQNPKLTYVDADCRIRSFVQMCIDTRDETICKKQTIRSNDFKIRSL